MEDNAPELDRRRILEQLIRAQVFEQVLHARYPGTKRFSIEGVAVLVPLLEHVLVAAADRRAAEVVLGMSHRGRLNVMAHIVGRDPVEIFTEFEDVDPRSVLGGGDVKYHIGATGEFDAGGGRRIVVRLVSNPSHLEAVDPVAMGRTRAKQVREGVSGRTRILPILVHGDAAFAGQGIAAETLNLANLNGYSVGGTLHIIANNLIGFTADPRELHSSRFASDVAKRLPIPIFHVNAEDPDAVLRVGTMALEYRYAFSSDVVIDLIGYRRYGHSEIDDPTATQPLLYEKIAAHPLIWKIYADRIGVDPKPMVDTAHEAYSAAQEAARTSTKKPQLSTLPDYWRPFSGGLYNTSYEVDTGVPVEQLKEIGQALTRVPHDFSIHPKVKTICDRRGQMIEGTAPVDFGMAELLAFGTLLVKGIPVRLSGQDSRRGTFGQRHAVLIDVKNEKEHIPLDHLGGNQAWFEAFNSMLSEAAVMGFEYGFSRDYPEALVLWEAQFGDFANGAQVVIDQFVAAGEDKWGLLSGLVLLLPHGYEGQGGEHSSARIERYLQLAGEDNFQICQPSTAAQYFHLLRRQASRTWRKPLVVLTPKSILRSREASSPIEAFSEPRFQLVLSEREVARASRLLVCSGKIGHELRHERKKRKDQATAIISMEQLYPFPEQELAAELKRHPDAREIVWVQEEPANMGALSFVVPQLERLGGGRPVRSVKRSASASTATGSAKAHELEQRALLTLAFGVGGS